MKGEPARLVAARLAYARAVKAGDPQRVEAAGAAYDYERARWLLAQSRSVAESLPDSHRADFVHELVSGVRALAGREGGDEAPEPCR